MRRILLALLSAAALVVGTAPSADAVTCAKIVEPKPCTHVKRCTWGGDPDSVFVEVRAATKKTAVARANKVVRNLKGQKVTPRRVFVYGFKNRVKVHSRTVKPKGKHWYYSEKQSCWYVK